MNRAAIAFAVAALACSASAAHAQTAWTDRGYFDLSGDVRLSPTTFTTVAYPVDFAETATVATNYDVTIAPGIDAAFGVRVWRNLALGVDASWLRKPSSGAISAQIPHPFFFNKPRSVSGDSTGLDHTETALHIQAVWMIPATPRWSIALAGGPSWITVDQAIVDDITITSAYPYDDATFSSAVSTKVSNGHIGFNVGGDVTYRMRPHAGVGVGVSFSQASVPLPTASGAVVTVTAGGARVNGGLRVRF